MAQFFCSPQLHQFKFQGIGIFFQQMRGGIRDRNLLLADAGPWAISITRTLPLPVSHKPCYP